MLEGKLVIESHISYISITEYITDTGYFIRQNSEKKDASVTTLLKEMSKNGIDKAVLLPIGIMPNYIFQNYNNLILSLSYYHGILEI